MMKIDSKRLRLILIGLIALSIVGFIGITIGGLTVLSSKSQQMVGLKVQSQTLDTQLSNLEQTKKDIEKYAYFKAVAKTVIPDDKDQAESVLEINQMADDSGISIQSITFPASTLGLHSTIAAPTTQDATSTSTSTKTAAISQAKPVAGIPGLYSLQLIITSNSSENTPSSQQVTYNKMIDFLGRIENNRHTAQITNISIEPAIGGQTLSFNLTINIFIKP